MKISAHLLVKNEENFIWYSIMSVIDYVDEILIYDTGSTDKTMQILNKIKSNKLVIKKLNIDKLDEDNVRQKMLDETNSDWIIILDADEVWWSDSIKKVTDTINKQGQELESIVVPTINMVGDIFHFQEKEAGRYNLAGHIGHYALRAINKKISGLHGVGGHGVFMWADENNNKIENRDKNKIKYIDAPYIHLTHLKRSENDAYKRVKKLKYEIGENIPLDYFYPEVFFKDKPDIVKSIWQPMKFLYKLRSYIETPLRKIYRRTLLNFKKHGY